jgi:hypothetical protein
MKNNEQCDHRESAPCAYFYRSIRHWIVLYCSKCDQFYVVEGYEVPEGKG